MITPDNETRNKEKRRLAAIRQRHVYSHHGWSVSYDGMAAQLLATDPASFENNPEPETVATLPHADLNLVEFLVNAHTDIGFLLAMLDRAIERIHALSGKQAAPRQAERTATHADNPLLNRHGNQADLAANCAILCNEPAFKKFLKTCHGLVTANDEATAAKVRELLGIASRKTLNTDPQKAVIWRKLVHDYEGWLRNG
jgi:hypothetical protein